jgi:formyl-CoA transferase
MLMAVSILGAYVRRLRTGQGEHLQLAMQDSILHYIRNAFAYMERTGGKPAPRAGAKTVGGGHPPIGIYPCKGGGPNDYVYIYTAASNPEHWTRLLKVMGREELIGDARYSTPAARMERWAEVDELVSAWTRQHDKHTAAKLIGSATIPSGAVLDTRELADEKTFEQRKIRQTMTHPTIGSYVMTGWPVRFGAEPPIVGPAPLLGQHSGNVMADWLEMDGAAIDKLKADKVIAEPR